MKILNVLCAVALVLPSVAQANLRKLDGGHSEIKLSAANVHWGYFSKTLAPVLNVTSGSEVVVEMATHHACDDYDKMILGDPGMEEIYAGEEFRGATGGGDGVHILTG